MGKKKNKNNNADDYWDNEFEKDAELTGAAVAEADAGETPVAAAATTSSATTANSDAVDLDGDGDGGLMATMRKAAANKKGKKKPAATQQQAPPSPTPDADLEEDGGDNAGGEIRIKSKKEKEKERKERAKLQKKKSTATQQQTPNASPKTDAVSEVTEQTAKLAVSEETAKKAPAAKGKKKGPAVAALRELLAAKQAEEEKARREEEEERLREEERIRKIEEEERIKEEARKAKKERERAKKEQLRKEGKLLTEAERKRQKMNQLKLEQLKAQGAVIAAFQEQAQADQETSQDGEAKSKRVVYDNRKKKKQQQKEKVEEAIVKVEEHPKEKEEAAAEEEEVVDSWEEVLETWEDLDEQEEEGAAKKEKEDAASEDEEESDDASEEDSSSDDEDDSSSDDGMTAAEREAERRKDEARQRREQRHQEALAARSKDDLRSPICVILGHVDTGKTKLLDKIRQTNVQEGEAGGITQQIGATYFPTDAIKTKTQIIRSSPVYSKPVDGIAFEPTFDFKVPGLLVIDTPGHESFTNLRSRGSSLCNIAILVIDIMHGLEPQTIESINLLKQRKTPFIVALNKIDRIYGWKETKDNGVRDSLEKQGPKVVAEFEDRLAAAKVALAEQGLNSELFWKNTDVRKFVSIVPTSAITGEGVPDLLMLLVKLTQERLSEKLMYLSELEATVLEVKVIEGHGTTIDVVLSNGILREGDRIVVCGLNGPIVTNIRALLTPQPMRELRVKSAYVHHKEIKAAMGVKISAPDLDKAIAGSRLLVVTEDDDEEEMKEEVMSDLTNLLESIDSSGRGVSVQASTLGSLEALLSFLKDMKIPVSGINIGPIHKRDIIRASVMLEHAKEFATILAFDVKVDKDAQEMADEMGVRIFKADIIYHLFDQFTAYMNNITEQRRKDLAPTAVWPCVLRIVPGCIFNKKDPIILGVDVVEGSLRVGTPLCVPVRGAVVLGKAAGIEANHKSVEIAKKGQQVAVRIECASHETPRSFGRHFEERDEIVSKISRQSIDVLKEMFRNDVSKEEWLLIKRLKSALRIE